jgi:hypothetical protein
MIWKYLALAGLLALVAAAPTVGNTNKRVAAPSTSSISGFERK